MVTPFDWQEGIGHRAQFVEERLSRGAPVLALSIPDGIVIFTMKRQASKCFEIYDRIAMAAIGQQSDVENLRVAALDFAHREGYTRSEQDVTIQRVVTALSAPIKKAFGDFSTAPLVVRALFAEVGPKPESDVFTVIDFDGDYGNSVGYAVLVGLAQQYQPAVEKVLSLDRKKLKPDTAVAALRLAWHEIMNAVEGITIEDDIEPEAIFLDRDATNETHYRVL